MILNAYYPMPLFPPVSISNGCALMCAHCMGTYLKGMEKMCNSENLTAYCKKLERRGGKGILVSGGCDKRGRIIHLDSMIDVLKKIKEETSLLVAVHPGYVDVELASRLVKACDVAFVDIIGSVKTARCVTGLKEMMGIDTLKNLTNAGISITPHLTIGLHCGDIVGEYDALETLKSFSMKKIVLNIICRTKGTPFEKIAIPALSQIGKVMKKAMEGREVTLGCMRPRGLAIEKMAIKIGITDIALLSKRAIRYATENGYTIRRLPVCCGITKEML